MHILNVRIDNVTVQEARRRARDFLRGEGCRTIWTPNPEILVAAHRHSRFRDVLNQGDLNICDGSGISLLTGGRVRRIPGSDFVEDLCDVASQENASVFLLGGRDADTLNDAYNVLQQSYPALPIVGAHTGPSVSITDDGNITLDESANQTILQEILAAGPTILLVGFGHHKQEMWIHRYVKHIPSVRIAMGVGGTFDMIAGKCRRAPKWLRVLHLEWLWRLLIEPRRITRIMTAIILFPILYLCSSKQYEHNQ